MGECCRDYYNCDCRSLVQHQESNTIQPLERLTKEYYDSYYLVVHVGSVGTSPVDSMRLLIQMRHAALNGWKVFYIIRLSLEI